MATQQKPARFDEIVHLVISSSVRNTPAPRVSSLLRRVYATMDSASVDVDALRKSVVELLDYLASEEGKSPENLQFVSDFVLAENEWEMDWSYLPDDFEDLMFDLSCLPGPNHPRQGFPLRSSPEHLLQRAHRLHIK